MLGKQDERFTKMTIDVHTVLLSFLGCACTVLGWLARELWDAVKSLRRDLSTLEIRITKDYVSYDRLKDVMQPVLNSLEEIKQTLTQKTDKPDAK